MNRKDLSRFFAKVERMPYGCWEWTGAKNGGYSIFYMNNRTVYGHRTIWAWLYGPIDPSLEIDHLCDNRPCVNPAHLRLATPRENTLRGATVSAANAYRTHCPKGHAYVEHVRVRPGGGRECRLCRRQQSYEAYLRRRNAARVPGIEFYTEEIDIVRA